MAKKDIFNTVIINGQEVKNAAAITKNVTVKTGAETVDFIKCFVGKDEAEKIYTDINFFGVYTATVRKQSNRLDCTVYDADNKIIFAGVRMSSVLYALMRLTGKSYTQVNAVWDATRSNKKKSAGTADGSTLKALV